MRGMYKFIAATGLAVFYGFAHPASRRLLVGGEPMVWWCVATELCL